MQLSNIPYKFQHVWGVNATGGFVTSPIPDTTAAPAASQQLGFPPATSVPVAGGGTPPNIDDFNGVFQYVTAWVQWQQAGGPIQYDSVLSASIGGYPQGTMLQTNPFGGFWLSLVNNNTSDPDTGGANWVSWPPHGSQAFTSSGTFTVPPGVYSIDGEVWGGGGGGGGTWGAGSVSLAGAGGGYTRFRLAVVPGQNIPIVVGAGGTAGAANSGSPTSGGTGGSSSANGTIVATGGGGGPGALNGIATGSVPGGVGSGGYVNITGTGGGTGFLLAGSTYLAGFGGGTFGTSNDGPLIANSSAAGAAGIFPGGGATGSLAQANGGAGAQGLVTITW